MYNLRPVQVEGSGFSGASGRLCRPVGSRRRTIFVASFVLSFVGEGYDKAGRTDRMGSRRDARDSFSVIVARSRSPIHSRVTVPSSWSSGAMATTAPSRASESANWEFGIAPQHWIPLNKSPLPPRSRRRPRPRSRKPQGNRVRGLRTRTITVHGTDFFSGIIL
jgi:hypothetical protein